VKRLLHALTLLCLLVVAVVALRPSASLRAQEEAVTLDDVNTIARRLYCPVCPNETLAACRTDACARWREEIRAQLAAGRTEQQIVDDFIARYGERVLGTPQDPTLRALSVYFPFVLLAIASVIGTITILRWRARRADVVAAPATDAPANSIDDDYRAQLERDLKN
jgi:cytochrome c-type biogenesis protein CcmH